MPPSTFLYLEKVGPFEKSAPLAWEEFIWRTHGLFDDAEVEAGASAFRIDRKKEGDGAFVYQAGILLKSLPRFLPEGLMLRTLEAGKYARFCLQGAHEQLTSAYPRAFAKMARAGLRMREGFRVEKYLNKAAITPVEDLRTEILIPVE